LKSLSLYLYFLPAHFCAAGDELEERFRQEIIMFKKMNQDKFGIPAKLAEGYGKACSKYEKQAYTISSYVSRGLVQYEISTLILLLHPEILPILLSFLQSLWARE
jgi:hypothetical protein